MSKFVMEVNLEGAAFHDDDGDFDPADGLSRILVRAASQVSDDYQHGTCYDTNGNPVGTWEIRE